MLTSCFIQKRKNLRRVANARLPLLQQLCIWRYQNIFKGSYFYYSQIRKFGFKGNTILAKVRQGIISTAMNRSYSSELSQHLYLVAQVSSNATRDQAIMRNLGCTPSVPACKIDSSDMIREEDTSSYLSRFISISTVPFLQLYFIQDRLLCVFFPCTKLTSRKMKGEREEGRKGGREEEREENAC